MYDQLGGNNYQIYSVYSYIILLMIGFTDSLSVMGASNELSANQVWGIIRGLETFSQLIYENDDGLVSNHNCKCILLII